MRDQLTQSRARELRRRVTFAEYRIWWYLRRRNIAGAKFRRQVPIGLYIADFVCHEAMLIIELDGSQHLERRYEDYLRDEYLRERGFRVLRFGNNDVFQEIEGVMGRIICALEEARTRETSPT